MIDVTGSYQPHYKHIPFQLWSLELLENKAAVLKMKEDLDCPVIITRHIPYTDFPLQKIQLYYIDNVLLLPSEY